MAKFMLHNRELCQAVGSRERPKFRKKYKQISGVNDARFPRPGLLDCFRLVMTRVNFNGSFVCWAEFDVAFDE